MSAVQLLRDLANQIEAGYLVDGRMLVPVPARDVKIGDRVSEAVGDFMTVDAIEPTGKVKSSDPGALLLNLKGTRTQPGYEGTFNSSMTAWADDWVVVER